MTHSSDEPRGELELVQRLRERLRPPPRVAGPAAPAVAFGDDMASVSARHPGLLWTVDMLMDGVDFVSREHGWEAVGRKAMAVNLSDCAAMGVQPVAALCAVAIDERLSLRDAETLVVAAHEMGLRYGCPIVGGDTNSWKSPTVVSISIAAETPAGQRPVGRGGAQAGDRIWVSGPLGGSILGRHLRFEPLVELGLTLAREIVPHAMIDISDGLALDLWRVLDASGVGACLDAGALETAIHEDARRLEQRDGRPALEHALHDGEDFELVVAVRADTDAGLLRSLGLIPIGEIVAEGGLQLRGTDGRTSPVPIRGWEHFR